MAFPLKSQVLGTCIAMMAALAFCTTDARTIRADDAASKPAAESPEKTNEAKPEDAPAEAADPFAVPEGTDPKVLGDFMKKLTQTAPEDRTPEGLVVFFNKLDVAFAEILTRDVDEATTRDAVGARSQILTLLAKRFGDKSAPERLKKFIASLEMDERPAIAAIGKSLAMQERISGISELNSEDRAALVQEVAARLNTKEFDRSAVGSAMSVADALEDSHPEEAVAALNLFAKYLESRKEEGGLGAQVKQVSERMRSTARRLGLIGNVMEVKGTTIDGHSFDVANWKGKVVLVDFWATWCGPCIRELPNVLSLYSLYHEKGFEVVGISLDDDSEALHDFLKERQIPWTTIFEPKAEQQGWENPLARHYGISGIPTAILINQEGKVITLAARGEALKMHLQKLLGPVEEAKPNTDAESTPPPAAPEE